jgi:hypothetical protein
LRAAWLAEAESTADCRSNSTVMRTRRVNFGVGLAGRGGGRSLELTSFSVSRRLS